MYGQQQMNIAIDERKPLMNIRRYGARPPWGLRFLPAAPCITQSQYDEWILSHSSVT